MIPEPNSTLKRVVLARTCHATLLLAGVDGDLKVGHPKFDPHGTRPVGSSNDTGDFEKIYNETNRGTEKDLANEKDLASLCVLAETFWKKDFLSTQRCFIRDTLYYLIEHRGGAPNVADVRRRNVKNARRTDGSHVFFPFKLIFHRAAVFNHIVCK